MTTVQGFSIHSPQASSSEDAIGFVVRTNAGEQRGSISRNALLHLSPGNKSTLIELFDMNRARILEVAFKKWSMNPGNVLVLGSQDF